MINRAGIMICAAAALLLAVAGGPALAKKAKKTTKATRSASLDRLLDQVRSGGRADSTDNREREARFRADRDGQQRLLEKARAALAAEQKVGEQLERAFDGNKARVKQLEQTLKLRLGTMGELFGVIRQVAGDTRGKVKRSLVSAQFPGRGRSLDELARSKALPTIKELEHLWYVLQHEMTESGKVTRFSAPVITEDGVATRREVVRIGVFNAIADGSYLRWLPDLGKLSVLKRQPASRYMAAAAAMTSASGGFVRMAIDPSRGSVLSLLVQTPSLWERVQLGGLVGYIVIGIGIVAFLIALVRALYLLIVGWKVRRQRASAAARAGNPLGRVIAIYERDPGAPPETMEARLDEAIMRESSRLERFLWVIKIGAVVAPLLGLLGTVTGMIRTFQAITLFGTGDPKLMAGGISEALVTTMLGLCVAIPLVLMHSWLRSMSKGTVEVLEEQSAGIIARRAEQVQV